MATSHPDLTHSLALFALELQSPGAAIGAGSTAVQLQRQRSQDQEPPTKKEPTYTIPFHCFSSVCRWLSHGCCSATGASTRKLNAMWPAVARD